MPPSAAGTASSAFDVAVPSGEFGVDTTGWARSMAYLSKRPSLPHEYTSSSLVWTQKMMPLWPVKAPSGRVRLGLVAVGLETGLR